MQGSSRVAVVAGQEALEQALSGDVDAGALAEDLFGVTGALDGNATLRRALADPSRDGSAKGELVRRLFGGKVGAPATDLLATLVAQRWAAERDLADAVEGFAVQALVMASERAGTADDLEDGLFRFERIVAGNAALREALTDRTGDPQAKAQVVGALLEGKVSTETLRLARQAVLAPRGRRFDRTVETYLAVAARRREQLSATVVSVIDLDEGQRERLSRALEGIYGKAVHLNVVIDPEVVGGIRIEIGDEVVDGTILRKLEGARRHFDS